MPRVITCPSCAAAGELPDSAAGRSVGCPVCQTVFVPPTPVHSPDGWGVWIEGAPAALARPANVPTPAEPSRAGDAEWIRTEAVRFADYVKSELARLDQARRDTAEAVSRAEAARVTRSLELTRQYANLSTRRAELETTEAGFAARAAELTRQEAALAEREAAVVAREARRGQLEREATDLSNLVADLRVVVERLRLQRDEWEATQTEIERRQAAIDRRVLDLGRAEVSVQRRTDELEEMEAALRTEFEARELELARVRTVLTDEAAALRGRPSVDAPTPPPSVWHEGGS